MLSIYKYFLGFVRIFVFGELPERFINYCILNRIAVWNIKKTNSGLYMNITVSDYKNIRNFRKSIDKKMKIKLIKKYGSPFIIARFLKRPGIILGIIVLVLVNMFFSQFIWSIEVYSKGNLDKDRIVSACEKMGVFVGVSKNKIDTYNLSQLLALDLSEVAWLSVNVEGTKLTVNATIASDTKDESLSKPTNIVASHDGVIKYAKIKNGKRMFEIGQAVRKGDVLVSGEIISENYSKYVNSGATIIAQTNRNFSVSVNKNYLVDINKNATKSKSIFKFFWAEIPLYLNGVSEYNSSFLRKDNLKLFGSDLPISLIKRNFVLSEKSYITLTKEQAENIAIFEVSKSIRKLPIESVKSFSVKIKEKNDSFLAEVKLICLEDISKVEIIETDY